MAHARDYFPGPGEGTGGRPIDASPEEVETSLWLLAKNGGSATRAARELYENLGWTHISRERIRSWAAGRFKARYEEIRTEKASDLEEMVAGRALELAIGIADVEDTALRRVAAGIADANGVEASIILRNLSQAKAQSIDKAGQLRNREGFRPGGGDITVLFARLERLGLAGVVDSTAVELRTSPADAGAADAQAALESPDDASP